MPLTTFYEYSSTPENLQADYTRSVKIEFKNVQIKHLTSGYLLEFVEYNN